MNLDIESLSLIGLSPTEYTLLYFLAHKKNLADLIFRKSDVESLTKRGLLENRDGYLYLTPDSTSLFGSVDYEEAWLELRRTYPSKSGLRRLQSSLDKTKIKYLQYLKKGEAIHSEVIRAINIEKQERKIDKPFDALRAVLVDWGLLLNDSKTDIKEQEGKLKKFIKQIKELGIPISDVPIVDKIERKIKDLRFVIKKSEGVKWSID